MPVATRRGLLAAIPSGALASGVFASDINQVLSEHLAIHPDAELLAVCARLVDLQAEWQRLWALTEDDGPETDADRAWYAYSEHVWPKTFSRPWPDAPNVEDVPALLLNLPARTPQGLRAKAAAVLALNEAGSYCRDLRDDSCQLELSLIRDAAGVAHRPLGDEA